MKVERKYYTFLPGSDINKIINLYSNYKVT